VSWDTLFLVMLFVAAPPVNLYPLAFGLTTKWRSTRMGRPMLEATIGLALLVDVGLSFRLFGQYPGLNVLRMFAFLVVIVAAYDKSIALGRQKVDEWRKLRSLRDLRES
jgi:hypothetical protein